MGRELGKSEWELGKVLRYQSPDTGSEISEKSQDVRLWYARVQKAGPAQGRWDRRSQFVHVCFPGPTMQCFKFLKVMMFLFNLIIFVSMAIVGFWGFPKKASHNLNIAQAGE